MASDIEASDVVASDVVASDFVASDVVASDIEVSDIGPVRHYIWHRVRGRLGPMMRFLTLLFTWWNGETAGTRLTLWRDGEFVGEDAFGNRYYRSRGGRIDPALGHERRWVIYKDIAEASKIPPGWHGWMHHRVATPPSAEAYQPREWQAPHEQNHTGTARAYRPPGSTLGAGARPAATGDYESWTPGH